MAMEAASGMTLCALLALLAVGLQGCGGGPEDGRGLASLLCTDTTLKLMEADGGLVSEHLDTIQRECGEMLDDVATCEKDGVGAIDRVKSNLTFFFIDHCIEFVTDQFNNATLEVVHPLVDAFAELHKEQLAEEMSAQVDLEKSQNASSGYAIYEVLCGNKVRQMVEQDEGLVHNHLLEIEGGCNSSADCELNAVQCLQDAKLNVTTFYLDLCTAACQGIDPNNETILDVSARVAEFGTNTSDDVKAELHAAIHVAMEGVGIVAMFSLSAPHRGRGLDSGLLRTLLMPMCMVTAAAVVGGLVLLWMRRVSVRVFRSVALNENDGEAMLDSGE